MAKTRSCGLFSSARTAVRAMATFIAEASMIPEARMADKVEETRYSGSDAVAVAVYSIVILLFMLAWAYVPA